MVGNQCEIPEGYDVHHIDGNKLNNSIYNLELIDLHKHRSEHNKIFKKGIKLSEEHKRKIKDSQINNIKKSKKVSQYTLDGELVKIWDSAAEAGRNGFIQSKVSLCCLGKRKTHKNFIWRYYNET